MLDFHGLFVSYVALFPGGVYMEIESLRLDLHLKRKQKKPQGQHQRFHRRRKKKKKTQRRRCSKKERKKKKKTRCATWSNQKNWVAPRPGSRSRDQVTVHDATWVAGCDLGRGVTAACVAGLDLARPGS